MSNENTPTIPTLLYGGHATRDEGMCAMEAVAWLAGEKHSDAPKCACPVIAAFVRRFNDRLPDDGTRTRLLAPVLPLIVGSRSTREVEIKRSYLCADFAVRDMAARVLDTTGMVEEATTLRALVPVTDKASAIAARDTSRLVRDKARSKYATTTTVADAAYAYAYAAYAYAAYADAAYADAAYADAAYAAREPFWLAGVDLIRRLCAVTAEDGKVTP